MIYSSDDSVAESSFSASLQGSVSALSRSCTHQLNTPEPAAAVAEQPAPLLGEGAFAIEAAGLEPGEDHVDRRRRPTRADVLPRLALEHVLTHRTAVGPHHVLG